MAAGILDLCSVELWSGSSSYSIDSHRLLGSMNHALERMAQMAVNSIFIENRGDSCRNRYEKKNDDDNSHNVQYKFFAYKNTLV